MLSQFFENFSIATHFNSSPIPSYGFLRSNIYIDPSATVTGDGDIDAHKKISFSFKLSRKVDRPIFCDTVEFINLPHPNSSPFVGGSVFTLMPELYNDKFAWTNGADYLSYALDSEGGSTWIIGGEPGVDAGYVHIKADSDVMTPISLESEWKWFWLQNGKWEEQDHTKLICRNEKIIPMTSQKYYWIEYFDRDVAHQTFFVPLMNKDNSDIVDGVQGIFYEVDSQRWIALTDIQITAAMGEPSMVGEEVAVMVNEEHGGSNTWSITFKRGIGHQKDTEEVNIRYGSFESSVRTLTSDESTEYHTVMNQDLVSVQKGNFVWLWYTKGDDDLVFNFFDSKVQSHDEVLLKCISATSDIAVFEFFLSDRLKSMKQSVLSKDSHFVIMNRTDRANIRFFADNSELTVLSSFNLGNDIIKYIKDYLLEKDKSLSLSACYMYHAAVSMPRALVYAGEILCVLMGAKPLTLIQYSSSSDHQWKFPLVREMSQNLIAAKHIFGDEFDIDYEVLTYNSDETLVFYRSNRKYLLDSLRPAGQAQALHPLPYPDRNALERDWKLQIYYAYWNGFVLGYPSSFIDSYCRSFHNGLSAEDKEIQINLARNDVNLYFRELKKSNNLHIPVLINFTLDTPLDEKFYEYLL